MAEKENKHREEKQPGTPDGVLHFTMNSQIDCGPGNDRVQLVWHSSNAAQPEIGIWTLKPSQPGFGTHTLAIIKGNFFQFQEPPRSWALAECIAQEVWLVLPHHFPSAWARCPRYLLTFERDEKWDPDAWCKNCDDAASLQRDWRQLASVHTVRDSSWPHVIEPPSAPLPTRAESIRKDLGRMFGALASAVISLFRQPPAPPRPVQPSPAISARFPMRSSRNWRCSSPSRCPLPQPSHESTSHSRAAHCCCCFLFASAPVLSTAVSSTSEKFQCTLRKRAFQLQSTAAPRRNGLPTFRSTCLSMLWLPVATATHSFGCCQHVNAIQTFQTLLPLDGHLMIVVCSLFAPSFSFVFFALGFRFLHRLSQFASSTRLPANGLCWMC